jgi:predicted nuclease with TOPRIM domain
MVTEKSSKKAGMITDEYEVLLQSALEDQAQHFEIEINNLRAEYTNSLVNTDIMAHEEIREMEDLKQDISLQKRDIANATKQLLEAQGNESRLRAASQRLFSEQQESNELMKKIQKEHRKENERGKKVVEDLENQISDLNANLSMRQQFSQSNEFSNAQIIGAVAAPDSNKSSGSTRRGKKKGRFSRK